MNCYFKMKLILGVLVRGGAKSIKSKQSKTKGKVVKAESSRKSSAYVEEEDEDDDDTDDSHFSSKAKKLKGKKDSVKSSKKSKGKSKKMQIIPWMDSKGKRGGINWKERLEHIAKQGQAAYKEVYRRAKVRRCLLTTSLQDSFSFLPEKVLRSSAFEGILLKATWPGDAPVPQEILTEIVKHSIPSFKYGRSVRRYSSFSVLHSALILRMYSCTGRKWMMILIT